MTINGRKSHVKRCLGVTKNSDGTFDENPDMWLDILRTDEFDYTDSDGQGYRFILKWADDTLKEDAEDYDNAAGIEGRKTELGKGTDPELLFDNDPSEYVPFRVIDELTISDSDIGQKLKYIFKNKNLTHEGAPIPTSRKIDTIRLYHSDTTEDDALNNPADTHVIPDERYKLIENTQDKTQYADMEVIRDWTHSTHHKDTMGQEIKVVLHNADIYKAILDLDVASSISSGINSSGDPTVAARMDPFQNIINVNWGGLAVEFLEDDK